MEELKMKEMVDAYSDFFNKFCESVGLNPQSPHLVDTPKRVVKALLELTSGYHTDPTSVLERRFPADWCDNDECDCMEEGNTIVDREDGILVVWNGIPFTSLCAHHLLPFVGQAYVGMLLKGEVIGLSKVPRVIRAYAQRLQIQEQMTFEIGKTLSSIEGSKGAIVLVDAQHMCMKLRGVRSDGWNTTSFVSGVFRTNDCGIKDEFMRLISPFRGPRW